MRAFAEAWPDEQIVQRTVGQLPWRHNIALVEKLKAPQERIGYAQQTLDSGWSRDVLVLQIESRLYQRQGGAITNFEHTLPQPQSDLVPSSSWRRNWSRRLMKQSMNLDLTQKAQLPRFCNQLSPIDKGSNPAPRGYLEVEFHFQSR